MPQPHPGRGAEEGALQLVLGESVELPARPLGGAQRLPERGGEVAQHADLGPPRVPVPAWPAVIDPERAWFSRPDQLARVLGGGGFRGRVLGLPDHVFDLVGPDTGPGHHASGRTLPITGPIPGTAPVYGDDGELAGARHAVGGERVARPPQVRGGGLLGDHHAVVGLGRGQRALDGLLRGRPASRGHAAPSSAVLSIRTPRSSTAGQPWLTGATWPGWPFPQLNAPPST